MFYLSLSENNYSQYVSQQVFSIRNDALVQSEYKCCFWLWNNLKQVQKHVLRKYTINKILRKVS